MKLNPDMPMVAATPTCVYIKQYAHCAGHIKLSGRRLRATKVFCVAAGGELYVFKNDKDRSLPRHRIQLCVVACRLCVCVCVLWAVQAVGGWWLWTASLIR